jgi:hypothetical protein
MSGHFRKEEEVLLLVLARYVRDVLGRRPVVKMLAKHVKSGVSSCSSATSTQAVMYGLRRSGR